MTENPHVVGGVVLIGRLFDKGFIQGPWQVETDAVVEHLREIPPEQRGGPHEWVTEALRLMNLKGRYEIRGEVREFKGIPPEHEVGIMALLMDEAEALAGDG